MATDPLASGEPTPPPRPVAGVRLVGAGRVRFCEAPEPGVDLHDWVLLHTGAGEEPGQVVIAPQQVAPGNPPKPLPAIVRRLTTDEIDAAHELAERACRELDRTIQLVGEMDLPIFITGLRFTQDGGAATLPYRGPRDLPLDDLAAALTRHLGVSIHLEWDGELEQAQNNLFGGLGRLRSSPADLAETIRERFDPLGGESSFAPEGLPRLGSRVGTEHGAGIVWSISTKHRTARVRLDAGAEVTIPLDALTPED